SHLSLHSFPTRRSSDLHLRLPYRVLARLDAHTSLEDVGVLVFVRRPELDPASRHRVERLVDDGASLIVVGHPGDLTELLGVQARSEEHTSELQSRENLV